MQVDHVPCGPFANESEATALTLIKTKLQKATGTDRWLILTNVAHALTSAFQGDEIDLIAVGPSGVHVVEIKHWSRQTLKDTPLVLAETRRLQDKVKRIASRIRKRTGRDIGFLSGKFLITDEKKGWSEDNRFVANGVRFFVPSEWASLLAIDGERLVSNADVVPICKEIEPQSRVSVDGDLRRLGRITDMELMSPKQRRFHRVFKGRIATSQDRVIVHLYDLSASPGPDCDADSDLFVLASREFQTLQKLQKVNCLPCLMDSFQEVPHYTKEMYFFSILDPVAPTLEQRTNDASWGEQARLEFSIASLKALASFQEAGGPEVVHRSLKPETVLVGLDNQPLFTDLSLARIPHEPTLSTAWVIQPSAYVAPELIEKGIASASHASDVYSLCATLLSAMGNGDTGSSLEKVRSLLGEGLDATPQRRPLPRQIADRIHQVCRKPDELQATTSPQKTTIPEARYWCEGLEIPFQGHRYRIVNRLGAGGIGITFKVVELDPATGGELHVYVGKVVPDEDAGSKSLNGYRLVRGHAESTRHLATVFDTAAEWQPNSFIALLKWFDGVPLSDLRGLLELYAEECEDAKPHDLVTRWIKDILGGLAELHRANLIHGDVKPQNMIVVSTDITLTDYDLLHRKGQSPWGGGSMNYCAPEASQSGDYSHDVYALAASFFQVLYDRDPFTRNNVIRKDLGLNWDGLEPAGASHLVEFLKRATHPVLSKRFADASDALASLQAASRADANVAVDASSEPRAAIVVATDESQWTQNEVPRLKDLLQTYPGSRWGNVETRGLDSDFAIETYVETALEKRLIEAIVARETRLVILCGNAGDGKTALLQYVAGRLGLQPRKSSSRVWDESLPNGLRVRINLDGSAAYQGRSAHELLEDFFAPFLSGQPDDDLVHLIAVNDGPLLQWLDVHDELHGSSRLTNQLRATLNGEDGLDGHIWFLDLNNRSLVGGWNPEGRTFQHDFLDRLFERMIGGKDQTETWKPCLTCTAQQRCAAWTSIRSLTAEASTDRQGLGARIRERMANALQAVHQRGEVHITVRELRAAVSFVFFGGYYCTDLHANPELTPPRYWDLAFSATQSTTDLQSSDEVAVFPVRQGELLRALTLLDPALEAHPKLDRYLTSPSTNDVRDVAPRYPDLTLGSARRRAYFEWSIDQIHRVSEVDVSHSHGELVPADASIATSVSPGLWLARGRYLGLFRDALSMNDEQLVRLTADLCDGLKRLEDLPKAALDRIGVVPLRTTPRTPIETTFWVEKQLEQFQVRPEKFRGSPELESLHRYLVLTYQYSETPRQETLLINVELFHTLMELKAGYQIADAASDDLFANLSIFEQRLAQEDQASLFGWSPLDEHAVYELRSQSANGARALVLDRQSIDDK